MYIITNKKNIIIAISETLNYQSNGNVLIDNGERALAKHLVNGVHEVKTVEEGVEANKYCYTPEQGFYENENYVEYYSTEERISALEDVVNILLFQ